MIFSVASSSEDEKENEEKPDSEDDDAQWYKREVGENPEEGSVLCN